jgi:hypothetical protein
MNPWNPTHEITIKRLDTGKRELTRVMLIDGAAYTESEWDAEDKADWTITDDGAWAFQGRPSPYDNTTVSIRAIGKTNRA